MSLRSIFRPASGLLLEAFGVKDQVALRKEIEDIVRREVREAADSLRVRETPVAEGSVWKDILVEDVPSSFDHINIATEQKCQHVLQYIPGTRLMRYGLRWDDGAWDRIPQIIIAPGNQDDATC